MSRRRKPFSAITSTPQLASELAAATHIPSKSLMRTLGPAGNPRADNLFEVVSFLQQREGVRFHVTTARL
jgi:DNA-binding phage protein